MPVVQRSPLTRNLMVLFVGAGVLLLVLPGRELGLPPLDLTALKWPWASSPKTVAKPRPLSPRALDTELVVDLSDRSVVLYRHQKILARYPLAVGQPGWETPEGTFRITEMRVNPDWQHPITRVVVPSGPGNPLGTRWIGFFHDEAMILGFHGTDQEDLIGSAVSHGCLRMRNKDIQALYQEVAVDTIVRVKT
ncbi:MAG: L,D-transpeptidase family protein [Alkalinema sp. RU_4_3]|nr:L,D-transpeptidase family protein [Alkalinema sp. RU_4_3]